MSYILDALRKSEQSRRPGGSGKVSGAVHELRVPLPGSGWLLALGSALLLGILAGLFIFWRGLSQEPVDLPSPAGVAETLPASAPVTAVENVAPVAAAKVSEEKTVVPEIAASKNNTAVLDLAEQAPTVRVAPKPKKPKPKVQQVKASLPSAGMAMSVAPPAASDGIPFLMQMPTGFQRQLPPIRVTIHVYSPDESQRILFLNNREYRKGEEIDEGIRVEEIVPEGAVLSYQGERFKVSRPN